MTKNDRTKLRTACYCRVSSNAEELLHSLDNQVTYFMDYVERQPDWKLVGMYIDQGKSGKSTQKRLGFQRMLRHCREGRIDLILVKSISRFARNTADFLETLAELKECGVDVLFEKENIRLSESDQPLVLTMLAAAAEEEIKSLSASEEWAWEKRAMQGKVPFKAILGYDVETVKGDVIVTVNEEEAALVRHIYALADEGMPLTHIARELNANGFMTKRGKADWTYAKVRLVLTNERYTGNVITRKMIKIDPLTYRKVRNQGEATQIQISDYHPNIISEATYTRVQKKIQKQTTTKRNAHRLHPMKGRVYCELCGSKCYHNHETQIRWSCSTIKEQPHLCDAIPVKDEELDTAIKRGIEERFQTGTDVDWLMIQHMLEKANELDFEYRRLSYLYRMQVAEAEEHHAESEASFQQASRQRMQIEREIKERERVWEQIEQDRPYRESWLRRIDPVAGDDIAELNGNDLAALVLRVALTPWMTFTITWIDEDVTEVSLKDIDTTKRIEARDQRKEKMPMPATEEKLDDHVQKTLLSPNDTAEEVPVTPEPDDPLNAKRALPLYVPESEPADDGEEKKRVCAYARVSTREEDQLNSFQFQVIHYTYTILQNAGWTFAGVYADEGISGLSTKGRKQFQKMIEDCKKGKIDKIITKSISRFSRNTVDCLEITRMLKQLPKPVEVFFEKENISTFAKDGELFLTVYSMMAQEESQTHGQNVKWARLKRAQRGEFNLPGKYFYGFDTDKEGNWVIHEKEGDVVRRVYREYLGGASFNTIAKGLTNDGIRTPQGKDSWNGTTVSSLLTNEKVIGSYQFQKSYVKDSLTGEVVNNQQDLPRYEVSGHHPAIIDQEQFEAVQIKIREKQGKYQPKRIWNQEVFRRTLYCGGCGDLLIHSGSEVKNQAGKKIPYHYWRCSVALKIKHAKTCGEKALREERIEATFVAMLMEMRDHPQLTFETADAIERLKLTRKEKAHIKKRNQSLEGLYQELYKAVDGRRKRYGEEDDRINALTEEIYIIYQELETYQERTEQIETIKEDLTWLQKELAQLKPYKRSNRRYSFPVEIYKRLVKRGVVHPDGRIVYDLSIGIQWTAYEARQGVKKRKDSIRKSK